jgi:FKBP-type peptidyl-prolyl cis-trans isomerase FkpA
MDALVPSRLRSYRPAAAPCLGSKIFSWQPAAGRICRYTGRMRPFPHFRALSVVALLVAAAACNNGSSSPTAPDQSSVAYSQTDLTVGTGAAAAVGTTATVQYGAWLYSDTAVDHKGTQFNAGTFSFVVGANQVIKGFDTGVTGMLVGGTRRLIVPPSLAFGATGDSTGAVPPNAALVFDVLLTAVQ